MSLPAKICIALLMLTFYISTAQYKLKVWDTRDGLSNNWISDITQDDKGYIWLATQYGLNRFDGYTFESFTHNPEDANSPSGNWVKRIVKKSEHGFWLGIDYVGLDSFHTEKTKFSRQLIVNNQGNSITSINKLIARPNGFLYIANGKGLFRKAPDKDSTERLFDKKVLDIGQNSNGQILFLSRSYLYAYDENIGSINTLIENTGGDFKNIFVDAQNQIFLLKKNALAHLKYSKGAYFFSKNLKINPLGSLLFSDNPIIEDSKNQIWIGGEKGISIVNKERSTVQFHTYRSLFDNNMEGVQALSFFEDKHKNMWIGTNKGLALISTFTNRFESDNILPNDVTLKDIRAFSQVENTLFVAADDGLFRVDTMETQRILKKKIYDMHLSKSGNLYAIGRGDLFEVDINNFKVKKLSDANFKSDWPIAEDKKGCLWMIANGGLVCYKPQRNVFETYPLNLKAVPRIDLHIDSKDRLWFCTLEAGIYVLENAHELIAGEIPELKNINHLPDETKSLSTPLAMSILEDNDGIIWVGTDAGLNAVDPETFKVKRYLKKDGLKEEKIMALLEDDYGDIWGSTTGNGIFTFNKKTETFSFYGQDDGLKSNNFLLSSSFKSKDGSLFFGSDNGIQVINPKLLQEFVRPKIDFFFTNASATSETGLGELKTINSQDEELVFDHKDNSLIVNYTTLNYHLAEKTTYRYKIGDIWQDNGTNRNITFTSLAPGRYEIEVAAHNPDLDFTNDSIRMNLVIRPPWWQTNSAYIGYSLLLFALLFGSHKFLLKRRLDKTEKIRLQELNLFKTNFFNNVAHEIKTPLTIISGMANNMQKKGTSEINKSIKTIIRNSDELNDLVNQILDLSKLEVGKLTLDLTTGDIIIFVRYLLSSFESLASAKEIRLHFLSDLETLYMDFDIQKTKHIFSNLISNAIKNTPVKGDIYLQITRENSTIQFLVKDNGIGISKEDLKLIFERYHQAEGQMGGTGIGLSFTKELVALMSGSITVESILNQGSIFRVTLPIEQKATKQIDFSSIDLPNQYVSTIPTSSLNGTTESFPVIQIIEDNLDVCSYLAYILKQDYRLNFDYNGVDGLKRVVETVPDLVITDLMMPGKNGFEVCEEIKSNPITDHIPVIMLTAKSDNKSKIEGLKLGADAYLEKPFDEKELILRISKLLEQREVLREKFRNPDFWESTKTKNEGKTNEFVLKVRKLIEENIDDSSFGILELCRALGISRSHLHRKLKALTNVSTTTFVQTVKLQKARQLLKTTEKNVSEIAYEVGFEDPAYFSRLFSKFFGYPPSETRKNL